MASGFETSKPTWNASSAGAPTASRCRRLAPNRVELRKGRHRWVVAIDRTDRKGTRAMLGELARLADLADAPLDWFDAALITQTLSRSETPGTAEVGSSDNSVVPAPERED